MITSRLHSSDEQLARFAAHLAHFDGQPELALEALERYERDCLQGAEEARRTVSPGERAGHVEGTWEAVIDRLLRQAHGLDLGARLAWVRYARSEVEALARRERAVALGADVQAPGTRHEARPGPAAQR